MILHIIYFDKKILCDLDRAVCVYCVLDVNEEWMDSRYERLCERRQKYTGLHQFGYDPLKGKGMGLPCVTQDWRRQLSSNTVYSFKYG